MKIITIILIFCSLLLTSCGTTQVVPKVTPLATNSWIILALGDSLTAGYGLPESENYPTQLSSVLQRDGYYYSVQNAGVSGDTTAGLLSRLDWILEGDTTSEKTSTGSFALAILCIGANDAFQGKSVADIEKNLRAIIEKIRAKNIPLLLAGMRAPFNLGIEYRDQYDTVFEKLAKEYKISYMPFFLAWVALDPKLNQEDLIHPTKEGYTIIVGNIEKILKAEKLIQK